MIFFGGTFNPWHEGHQAILNELLTLGKVTVCVLNNPFKEIDSSFSERVDNIPYDQVCYCSENSLVKVIKLFPETKSIVLGADSWNNIDEWANHEFLKDYEVLVFNRGSIKIKERSGYNYRVLEAKIPNISSTELRKK